MTTTTEPSTAHNGADLLDPLTAALGFIVKADQWQADALRARELDDHPLAGRLREQERACLKRAEVLTAAAAARALEDAAESLARIALSL